MKPTTPPPLRRILPAAASLLAAALAAGCACTVGFREVNLEATVDWLDPEQGTFGTFGFTVSRFRGTHLPDSDSIGWGYDVEVEPESLAVVQIRQGPGPVGGRLLYDFAYHPVPALRDRSDPPPRASGPVADVGVAAVGHDSDVRTRRLEPSPRQGPGGTALPANGDDGGEEHGKTQTTEPTPHGRPPGGTADETEDPQYVESRPRTGGSSGGLHRKIGRR